MATWTFVVVSAVGVFVTARYAVRAETTRPASHFARVVDEVAPRRPRLDSESTPRPLVPQTSLVVHDRDGRAIAGARVDAWWLDRGLHESWVTDAAGVAHLGGGRGVFRASAPGRAGRVWVDDLDGESRRVELAALGRVVVRWSDDGGRPVEGLVCALLPPRGSTTGRAPGAHRSEFEAIDRLLEARSAAVALWTRGEAPVTGPEAVALLRALVPANPGWGADVDEAFAAVDRLPALVQRSDVSGVVAWDGVPALDGYRWTLLDDVRAVLDPPEPASDLVTDDSGRLRPGEPSRSLSGVFAVPGATEVVFEPTLVRATAVFGRLRTRRGPVRRGVEVELAHRDAACRTFEPCLTVFSIDGLAWTDDDGGFEFAPALPGRKRLSAYSIDDERNVSFFERRFELGLGEERDLGVIDAREGVPVEVVVTPTVGGRPVAPEAVFAGPGAPGALLQIAERTASVPADERGLELLQVDVGRPLTLRGLRPGTWSLSAMRAPGTRFRAPWRSAPRSASLEVDVPPAGLVSVPLDLEGGVECRIDAKFPADGDVTRVQGWLFDPLTGREYHGGTSSMPDVAHRVASFSIASPPGPYELMLQSYARESDEVSSSWTASTSVDVGPSGTAVSVRLEPGARIDGRVLSVDGTPIAGVDVFAVLDLGAAYGGTGAGAYRLMGRARTSRDGRFALVGLAPGHLHEIKPTRDAVVAPEAGASLEIDLVRRESGWTLEQR